MGALWVVCGSIRERNYRLKKKNYLSGPTAHLAEKFRSLHNVTGDLDKVEHRI